MNGNFEIDKSSYPYSRIRIGETHKLVHTPTQDMLTTGSLPIQVADAVALRLNALHYTDTGKSTSALLDHLEDLNPLIRIEAATAFDNGVIDGIAFSQIQATTF